MAGHPESSWMVITALSNNQWIPVDVFPLSFWNPETPPTPPTLLMLCLLPVPETFKLRLWMSTTCLLRGRELMTTTFLKKTTGVRSTPKDGETIWGFCFGVLLEVYQPNKFFWQIPVSPNEWQGQKKPFVPLQCRRVRGCWSIFTYNRGHSSLIASRGKGNSISWWYLKDI